MTRAPDWTPEEDERLRELAGTVPMRDAALVLGRSLMAVRTRSSDLEIDWRASWPFYTLPQLVTLMRMSRRGILALAKRAGVMPGIYGKNTRTFTDDDVDRMSERKAGEREGRYPRPGGRRRKDRPDIYVFECRRCGRWTMKSPGYVMHMGRDARPTCARCRANKHGRASRDLIGTSKRARNAYRAVMALAERTG